MVFNYKKNRAWTESLSIVMQIGLTMAGCILFCFFIGLYLDRWLGTKGILLSWESSAGESPSTVKF